MDILDTTNYQILIALNELLEDISRRKPTKNTDYSPIFFDQSGRDITFYNGANIFSTVIGVYKDGSRVDKIVLNGDNIFPTSIVDFLELNGTAFDGVNPYNKWPYKMTGDGYFNIRIRTGLPLYDDGTLEYAEAQQENALSLLFHFLNMFVPFLDKSKVNCLTAVASDYYVFLQTMGPPRSDAALLYYLVSSARSHLETIGECFGVRSLLNDKYFKLVGKFFKLLDRPAAVVGEAANICFYVYQWRNTPPAFDTCYFVNGSSIEECGVHYTGYLSQSNWQSFLINGNTNYTGDFSLINVTLEILLTEDYTGVHEAKCSFDIEGKNVPNFTSDGPFEIEMKSFSMSSSQVIVYLDDATFSGSFNGDKIDGTLLLNVTVTDHDSGKKTKIQMSTPMTLSK